MRYLLEQQEWDFAFITFCAADYLQHRVWADIMRLEPKVVQYYLMLDEALGFARATIGNDGVLFVVSDHGFQEARTKFAINEYLLRQKWLHTSRQLNHPNGMIHTLGKQILNQFNLLEYGRTLKYRWFKSRDQERFNKQKPYLTWQEQ